MQQELFLGGIHDLRGDFRKQQGKENVIIAPQPFERTHDRRHRTLRHHHRALHKHAGTTVMSGQEDQGRQRERTTGDEQIGRRGRQCQRLVEGAEQPGPRTQVEQAFDNRAAEPAGKRAVDPDFGDFEGHGLGQLADHAA